MHHFAKVGFVVVLGLFFLSFSSMAFSVLDNQLHTIFYLFETVVGTVFRCERL